MSVVNRMLRDLAARRAQTERVQPPLPGVGDWTAEPRRAWWAWGVAVVGVALAAALPSLTLVALWPTELEGKGGAGESAPVVPRVSAEPEPQRVGRTLLRELRLESEEGADHIELALTRPVSHHIETVLDPFGLVIHLADTRPVAALGEVLLGDGAVTAIHLSVHGSATRLRLDLAEAVRTTSAMVHDDADPRLELSLMRAGRTERRATRADRASGADEPPDLEAAARVPEALEAEPMADPGADPDPDVGPEPTAATPPPVPAAAAAASFEKRVHAPVRDGRADLAYDHGIAVLEAGRPEAAEAAFLEALSLDPEHPSAHAALVRSLLNQRRSDSALEAAQRGLARQPENPQLARLAAQILISRGAADEARALLETRPPTLAADPEYHAVLAALYQQTGDAPRAAQLYERVLHHEPTRAAWWMGLGLSLEDSERRDEALRAYRSAALVGGLSADAARFVRKRIAGLERAPERQPERQP